jgi:hypothetical protein
MNSVAETIGMKTATMGPGMSEVAVARPEQYLPAKALKLQGQAAPLGATLSPEGANFSFFSASATGVIILLFDHVDARTPRKLHILQHSLT